MSEKDSAEYKGTEAPASRASIQTPEVVRSVETAQPATQQQLDKVEREMNAFERSTLKWTRITCAVFAVTLIFIGLQWIAMRGQLRVMNGQLEEMKSGGADTHALAVAAAKQAEAADTQAQAALIGIETAQAGVQATQTGVTAMIAGVQTAQIQATIATEALKSSKAALEASAESVMRELRPYVSVSDMQVVGVVENGNKFNGVAKIINSGRTPAIGVEVCGDVVLTASPITDDYACPSPTSPKRVPEGENSVVAIGSGLGGQVSSPGTTMDIQPVGLVPLLTAHQFRLYFYGYVTYKDTIRPDAIHHTTFCGMYGYQSKTWGACEKHNHMD